jgi:hypothetical protein
VIISDILKQLSHALDTKDTENLNHYQKLLKTHKINLSIPDLITIPNSNTAPVLDWITHQ